MNYLTKGDTVFSWNFVGFFLGGANCALEKLSILLLSLLFDPQRRKWMKMTPKQKPGQGCRQHRSRRAKSRVHSDEDLDTRAGRSVRREVGGEAAATLPLSNPLGWRQRGKRQLLPDSSVLISPWELPLCVYVSVRGRCLTFADFSPRRGAIFRFVLRRSLSEGEVQKLEQTVFKVDYPWAFALSEAPGSFFFLCAAFIEVHVAPSRGSYDNQSRLAMFSRLVIRFHACFLPLSYSKVTVSIVVDSSVHDTIHHLIWTVQCSRRVYTIKYTTFYGLSV